MLDRCADARKAGLMESVAWVMAELCGFPAELAARSRLPTFSEDMPPWFATCLPTRRLHVVEQRAVRP